MAKKMTKAQIKAMHAKKGQTARGKAQDLRQTAKNTLPATKTNVTKWEKAPGKMDIMGIDTKISVNDVHRIKDVKTGMKVVFYGRNTLRYTVVDVKRTYAYLKLDGGFPGITPIKKERIATIKEHYLKPTIPNIDPKNLKGGKTKEIRLRNKTTGSESTVSINADREPENWIKHNAPNFKYLGDVDTK